MYSPQIRADLIPHIYRVAKETGIAMTTWVNQVVEQALPKSTGAGGEENENQRKEEKQP